LTGFVRLSVGLSHMSYVEYLFNLTTQLDNTSLAQMLHVVQCVCVCELQKTHFTNTRSAQKYD